MFKKLILTLCILVSCLTGLHAEKIFDKTYTSHNFNTTPVTISGLKGDTYDYSVIIKFTPTSTGDNSLLRLHCNGDTTAANYRSYYMFAYGSAVTGSAVDSSSNYCRLCYCRDVGEVAMLMISITGESGDERYIEGLSSGTTAGGPTKAVWKHSNYWQNTADEITSFTFDTNVSHTADAHIIIYRTPKEASQSRWELMESKTLSSQDLNASPVEFSGLSGDSDIKYKININLDTTADEDIFYRFNNDTGSNYLHQQLQNNGGSISAANHTTAYNHVTYSTTGDRQDYTGVINAESGVKRLVTQSWGNNKSVSGFEQIESSMWWNNTADEITSIKVSTINTSSATGSIKLYRLKNTRTTGDTLPFSTIETVSISGDFSAGHTFNGLSLDDATLVKIEFIGQVASSFTQLLAYANTDTTTSNYPHQNLQANYGSVSASSSTSSLIFGYVQGANSTCHCVMYLYPKSGDNRPALSRFIHNNGTMENSAHWWSNSADEITSLLVKASSTLSITGTLKLSILK